MSRPFNSPYLRRGGDKQQRYQGFFVLLRKGNKDTNKIFKEQNSGDSTKSITTSTLVPNSNTLFSGWGQDKTDRRFGIVCPWKVDKLNDELEQTISYTESGERGRDSYLRLCLKHIQIIGQTLEKAKMSTTEMLTGEIRERRVGGQFPEDRDHQVSHKKKQITCLDLSLNQTKSSRPI